MDQKCVKKMRKRKDLDKLIGNGRKHIRKKSGHVLLKTDSQSSISSFETDQVTSIRYHKCRCSSFLTYANFCLSICLLIVCCVLIGLILVIRSDLDSLQKEFYATTGEAQTQSIQLYLQLLNKNLTKQDKNIKELSHKISLLEKKFLHIKKYKRLFSSLSDNLRRLNETRNDDAKALNEYIFKHSSVNNSRVNYTVPYLFSLERNISDLSLRLSNIEKQVTGNNSFRTVSNDARGTSLNESIVSLGDYRELLRRVSLIEINLHKLNNTERNPLHGKENNERGKSTSSIMKKLISSVEALNYSVQHLRKNLPDGELTLGLPIDNSTTTAKGVILRPDEYLKLKKNSVAAYDAFIASNRLKLRVDILEKEIENLRREVSAYIKEAVKQEHVGSKTNNAGETKKGDPLSPSTTGNDGTKTRHSV